MRNVHRQSKTGFGYLVTRFFRCVHPLIEPASKVPPVHLGVGVGLLCCLADAPLRHKAVLRERGWADHNSAPRAAPCATDHGPRHGLGHGLLSQYCTGPFEKSNYLGALDVLWHCWIGTWFTWENLNLISSYVMLFAPRHCAMASLRCS